MPYAPGKENFPVPISYEDERLQSSSEFCGEEKNPLPPPGIKL
jgi:hypothetical protein